jgi:hypothetical protein
MNNTQTQNIKLSLQDKLLTFKCPDLDTPYDSKEMQCCQYCFHIPESQVHQSPEKWVCDLPNREAQRRHWASVEKNKRSYFNE